MVCSYSLLFHTGGYGFVFIAQDLKTGKEYALKVLNHPDNDTLKSKLYYCVVVYSLVSSLIPTLTTIPQYPEVQALLLIGRGHPYPQLLVKSSGGGGEGLGTRLVV